MSIQPFISMHLYLDTYIVPFIVVLHYMDSELVDVPGWG